jgi:hypothetical protein
LFLQLFKVRAMRSLRVTLLVNLVVAPLFFPYLRLELFLLGLKR